MSRSLAATGFVLTLAASSSAATERAPDAVPLDAPVVVMGELHDVARHHENQAAWVARLAPRAVVFEMLPPAMGPLATRMKGVAEAELEAALEWTERGWSNFPDYHRIFVAAGDARIFGAEVPRAELTAAIEDGAGAVLGGPADRYGLADPIDPDEQARREAEQDAAHCGALPAGMLPGMVEAQRLRDAVLADVTLAALDATGGPVAVITGNGHARRDQGVPSALATARPDLDVISLGQFTELPEAAPFDAWVVDGARDPSAGDPCDAFD